MAQSDAAAAESPPESPQDIRTDSLPYPGTSADAPSFFFGREHDASLPAGSLRDHPPQPHDTGSARRIPRRVVPQLPRTQTFKRQQSERRINLSPVEATPAERRAVSADRRVHTLSPAPGLSMFRSSAPELLDSPRPASQATYPPGAPPPPPPPPHPDPVPDAAEIPPDDPTDPCEPGLAQPDASDVRSVTSSQWASAITEELEKKWILNLSMHFRDKSKREKFFVTYRERDDLWRRVTVSLDYREAPENSLEEGLAMTKYQREKSAKIYEAIRDSLADIQFYDTVTNLKLETQLGRLHVHVVEDSNEIIKYPPVRHVQHLGCRRVRERDIVFDSHMSGFVYKVRVDGQVLVKKEIPGPDTIDEFLYEINALSRLNFSRDVIRFYGVVVDDNDEHIRGLLIAYAERGALIDVIFDHRQEPGLVIPWPTRERWAVQIVRGLADIHETGFVQGDFTLSNIVVDARGDAKIIDINRRGCPVGWEPPEATPLTESNQRISMYIGVKSDLFQLGMVLWALAMQEEEPESLRRPLRLPPDARVPLWYRHLVSTCLSDDPRQRLHASTLAQMIPEPDSDDDDDDDDDDDEAEEEEERVHGPADLRSVSDASFAMPYVGYPPPGGPRVKPGRPSALPGYFGAGGGGDTYMDIAPANYDRIPYSRGRSPPSTLPSDAGRWGPVSRCSGPRAGRGDTYSRDDSVALENGSSAATRLESPTRGSPARGSPALGSREGPHAKGSRQRAGGARNDDENAARMPFHFRAGGDENAQVQAASRPGANGHGIHESGHVLRLANGGGGAGTTGPCTASDGRWDDSLPAGQRCTPSGPALLPALRIGQPRPAMTGPYWTDAPGHADHENVGRRGDEVEIMPHGDEGAANYDNRPGEEAWIWSHGDERENRPGKTGDCAPGDLWHPGPPATEITQRGLLPTNGNTGLDAAAAASATRENHHPAEREHLAGGVGRDRDHPGGPSIKLLPWGPCTHWDAVAGDTDSAGHRKVPPPCLPTSQNPRTATGAPPASAAAAAAAAAEAPRDDACRAAPARATSPPSEYESNYDSWSYAPTSSPMQPGSNYYATSIGMVQADSLAGIGALHGPHPVRGHGHDRVYYSDRLMLGSELGDDDDLGLTNETTMTTRTVT